MKFHTPDKYMEGGKIHFTTSSLIAHKYLIRMIKPRSGITVLEMNIFNRITKDCLEFDVIEKQ